MPEPQAQDELLYLGIDGGGTKCSAVLTCSNQNLLGRGLAGPANSFRDFEQTIDSIEKATALALEDAGLSQVDLSRVIAGVGLAGVNLPIVFEAMTKWEHPYKEMFLTTDLEIACAGAHDGHDGGVIVVGTGSSGCSIVNGEILIIGAHGFEFGDTSGGAWLGRQAIRAVLLAEDDIGPKTQLTGSVSKALGANGASIVEKMVGAKPSDFADLAGLVFTAADRGDEVATDIIQQGASHLSHMVRKLASTNPPAISILGGLRDLISPWLDDDVKMQLVPAKQAADVGAVIYAEQKHREMEATAEDVNIP